MGGAGEWRISTIVGKGTIATAWSCGGTECRGRLIRDVRSGRGGSGSGSGDVDIRRRMFIDSVSIPSRLLRHFHCPRHRYRTPQHTISSHSRIYSASTTGRIGIFSVTPTRRQMIHHRYLIAPTRGRIAWTRPGGNDSLLVPIITLTDRRTSR